MLVISWFICGALFGFLYLYLYCTMALKEKFSLNYKSIIALIILGIENAVLLQFNITYIKPYIVNLTYLLFTLLIYKDSFIKMLIWSLYFFVIINIAELVFSLIFVLVLNNIESNPNYNALATLGINMIIFALSLFISMIPFVRKLLNFILDWYNKNEYKSLMIFTFLAFTIFIFISYNNFINILPKSLLWFTNIFYLAAFVFVIGYFREKTTKNKLIYEYDQLMEYIKTYEALLDEKNKNQHEYKNQLAVIRVMVKDKKTLNYIDSLLHNETEEDLETINKLKYIPKGGLKGLIYYKIDSMKKRKIKTYINVSSELKTSKIWKTCDSNLQQVSKVLGVYLDNAIEAAEGTKEKVITLDVYLDDDNIVFEISNTFKGPINIEKIGDKGYSTKGEGHGYGLALVKDIISKSEFLKQDREINGNYYIQRLYIKNKV